MCDREGYKISCTTYTSDDVQSAYADEAEKFYRSLSNASGGEHSTGITKGNVDLDEMATDDGKGDPLADIETGDKDMSELVMVGIDDERRIVHSELEKGCGCPQGCYSQMRFTPYNSACWSCKK